MNIGTLNISGRGRLTESGTNKWNSLNHVLREEKLGILALQETHLNKEQIDTIHTLYGRRIRVFSCDTERTDAEGVAFVLNREIVDIADVKHEQLIPGRALSLTIHWHKDKNLTLLNVYAPNNPIQNTAFWKSLEKHYANKHHQRPDIVMGDFNITEETIDRLPPREDHSPAIEALQSLMISLHLKDCWRLSNPNRRDYTFPQRASEIRSRIDRMYATEEILKSSQSWSIKSTSIPTDHRLAIARISTANAPYIGKGRWTIPLSLLTDLTFMEKVKHLGQASLAAATATAKGSSRSDRNNPQTAHKKFKVDLISLARQTMKNKSPKLEAAIRKLTKEVDRIQALPSYITDHKLLTDTEVLLDRIVQLEKKRYQYIRDATTARYALNAETITKYWSSINREKRPRDVIYSLKKPSDQEYTTRSDDMAELTRNYHNDLQQQDVEKTISDTRCTSITRAKDALETKLDTSDANGLKEAITANDIAYALKKAQSGKASGLDGIPYELWQTLYNGKVQDEDEDTDFNGIDLLKLVYNDIRLFGVVEETDFADGWMCPIYKKQDRRDVSNYRPITVLNTDYKLYTRILTSRLASVVKKIVHPNQAGFIPGRHITDHTQTCKTLVDFAEATEVNGVIVALDQEKAYNKIRHDYLWEILEAAGIPKSFIDQIKSLYKHAKTIVIINGESSSPFNVIRGVRQGDPLSCLIFDIAIEPLACALRQSKLRGFQIPGCAERLITNLFADDTSVFLSQYDKWDTLWTILDSWCEASGARFNNRKTEIIPVGTAEYRSQVIHTRKINPQSDDTVITESVHIAKDGEAVRILRAWIGNHTDGASIWSPAIDKVQKFLTRWGHCNPTMTGKRHIIQMGPGGITQYLTTVQGMPPTVETILKKIIRNFVWGEGKTPTVNIDTLYLPKSDGGLGILDISSRNEAIDLMWLKNYLTLTDDRPIWAYLIDGIISLQVRKSAGAIQNSAQINMFLQNWDPRLDGASPLPQYIHRMLKTAKKYNTSFAAIKLDKTLKEQLPAWYHISATKQLRRLDNTSLSKCLRINHQVQIVADLMRVARHDANMQMRSPDSSICDCPTCINDRSNGCRDPLKCKTAAGRLLLEYGPKWNPYDQTTPDGLTLTAKRQEDNNTALEKGNAVTFNPSVTERGGISDAFRIFIDQLNVTNPPALRPRRGITVTAETCNAYVLASPPPLQNNSGPRAKPSGKGMMIIRRTRRHNDLVGLSSPTSSDPRTSGEILAAIHATQITPKDAPIHFICETDMLCNTLCRNLTSYEDSAWTGIDNKEAWKTLVNLLRQRCAITTFRKANNDSEWKIITKGRTTALRLESIRTTTITLNPDPHFNLSGIRISTLSQRIAYRMIREHQKPQPRAATARIIKAVQDNLKTSMSVDATPTSIWNSIHQKEIRKPVADFMWKCLHNAIRCGSFWKHIPGYEDRSVCPYCNSLESMRHILTECQLSRQNEIWNLAGQLWTTKQADWNQPNYEDILGLGLCQWKTPTKRRRPAADRFWKILISESAYLIWCLRCERSIQHSDDNNWNHSHQETVSRWIIAIQKRLNLDIAMTHHRFGRQAIKRDVVLNTWRGTLEDELALPDDWIRSKRVLVGITLRLNDTRIGDG